MRRALLVLAAALLAIPATAAGGPRTVPPDAVAVVAGEPILRSEFDTLMAQVRRSYGEQGRKFPREGTESYEQLKKQAVEFLVTRTMLRQKATALGIVVTPAEVAARRAEIVRDYFDGSEARFRRQLVRLGYTEGDFRREVEGQLVEEHLYEVVTAGAAVTGTELEVYYYAHLEDFELPASRDVRHILVKTRALAVALRARILRGESFAALARRYSTDPGSKPNGGKLTIGRGQTVAAFDRVAFGLRKGQLSQPVHTQYGWHLIQALSAVRPGRTTSFDAARTQIERMLLQQKRNDLMREWFDDTLDEYETKVEYAPGFEP